MKIVKKIIILLLMTNGLLGSSLYSIEAQEELTPKEGFAYHLSLLPKELRQQIVYLALLSELGCKYELFKKIEVEGPINSVAFSPDGKTVLTGSRDKTARLWSVETGQEIQQLDYANSVNSVAFSPDGDTVLTGSCYKTACLWNVKTGQLLQRLTGHADRVSSVAFSPDGKTALTGSWDKTVRLWDVETGKKLQQLDYAAAITSVAFSPDGRTFLTGSGDGTARLYHVETGKQLQEFIGNLNFDINSAAFSPDSKTVLTGARDKTARLWDVKTGEELKTFAGHTGVVISVAFSPDGKTVLTGSLDKAARLWDVKTGKELRQFTGQGKIVSVAFNKDSIIALGSFKGILCLWGLNFTLPVKQQQETWQLFKDKALYAVLSNKAIITEEPKSDSCSGLDESSQIDLCILI